MCWKFSCGFQIFLNLNFQILVYSLIPVIKYMYSVADFWFVSSVQVRDVASETEGAFSVADRWHGRRGEFESDHHHPQEV